MQICHVKDPETRDFKGFCGWWKGSRRLDRERTLDICPIGGRSTEQECSTYREPCHNLTWKLHRHYSADPQRILSHVNFRYSTARLPRLNAGGLCPDPVTRHTRLQIHLPFLLPAHLRKHAIFFTNAQFFRS